MNKILCGLPMSGKTTIGKLLASRLGCNFIDTDRLIENAYAEKTGKRYSCRQIFLEDGEGKFRELERQQIASLNGIRGHVIAVGGGTLMNPENRVVLQSIGNLIYLKTAEDVLWERMQRRGIPAYLDPLNPEKSFRALAEKRTPIFEQAAHLTIDTTNLSLEEVINIINP